MKISMFKFYKIDIICFLTLGIFVIVGSIIFTIYYYSGNGVDDYIFLLLCIPLGIFIILFPICLFYRALIYVLFEDKKCTSYSLLKKKLCEVDLSNRVFYSEFYVKFLYVPPIKFIALSNEPFVCKQNPKSILERGFYGSYNQKKIIIFPYDEQIASFLSFDEFQRIN